MRLEELDRKMKQRADIIRHRTAFDKMEKAVNELLLRCVSPDNSKVNKHIGDHV